MEIGKGITVADSKSSVQARSLGINGIDSFTYDGTVVNKFDTVKAEIEPKGDESEENWMARCMTNEQMQADYDMDQRAVKCQEMYEAKQDKRTDKGVIYMIGVVGVDVLLNEVIEATKDFDKEGAQLQIFVFSEGGDLFEGAAIYSYLKRLKATTEIVIQGLAASAMSYIAMAGDTVTMEENAMLMIHNAWVMTAGDQNELRKTADAIEKKQQGMVDAFVERTGLERERIQQMLDDETWMNAEEAKELGFVDQIFAADDEDDMAIAASAYKPNPKILENYKRDMTLAATNRTNDKSKSNAMNEEILRALGIEKPTAQVKTSDVVASINHLKTRNSDLEEQVDAKAELVNDLQSKVEEKENKISEYEQQLQQSSIKELVAEVQDEAGVKLADEPLKALKRRAEMCLSETDEQRKADLREDMVMYAELKGVKEGGMNRSTDMSKPKGKRPNAGMNEPEESFTGGDRGVSFERQLMNMTDEVLGENPDLPYNKAVAKARERLSAESRNGQRK